MPTYGQYVYFQARFISSGRHPSLQYCAHFNQLSDITISLEMERQFGQINQALKSHISAHTPLGAFGYCPLLVPFLSSSQDITHFVACLGYSKCTSTWYVMYFLRTRSLSAVFGWVHGNRISSRRKHPSPFYHFESTKVYEQSYQNLYQLLP